MAYTSSRSSSVTAGRFTKTPHIAGIRPHPQVYFWIRNFFFADTKIFTTTLLPTEHVPLSVRVWREHWIRFCYAIGLKHIRIHHPHVIGFTADTCGWSLKHAIKNINIKVRWWGIQTDSFKARVPMEWGTLLAFSKFRCFKIMLSWEGQNLWNDNNMENYRKNKRVNRSDPECL